MQQENPLISANIEMLQQGIALIEDITDQLYTLGAAPISQSGVGAHVRHCLDFYSSFLAGVIIGRIDYDARGRDISIERDRAAAVSRMKETADALEALPSRHVPEVVLVNLEGERGPLFSPAWKWSSIGRELQSLLSHTVHHYAMIAILLRLHGYQPSADFGIAPSTLRYMRPAQTNGRCATGERAMPDESVSGAR